LEKGLLWSYSYIWWWWWWWWWCWWWISFWFL